MVDYLGKRERRKYILLLETLIAMPEVVGSIPTQDKYLFDEHEFYVWV